MADKKDYYEVLGVNKNATDAEIKKARNELAAKYQNPASKGDNEALAKMKEINEARETLKDPEKRRKYDATLSPGRREQPKKSPPNSPPSGNWNSTLGVNPEDAYKIIFGDL